LQFSCLVMSQQPLSKIGSRSCNQWLSLYFRMLGLKALPCRKLLCRQKQTCVSLNYAMEDGEQIATFPANPEARDKVKQRDDDPSENMWSVYMNQVEKHNRYILSLDKTHSLNSFAIFIFQDPRRMLESGHEFYSHIRQSTARKISALRAHLLTRLVFSRPA
jgi:hypothetical protein